MKNKINLMHFLMVPVMTILLCNGLTMSFARLFSYWSAPFAYTYDNLFLGFHLVLLTILYGLYLHFFRQAHKRNLVIIGITALFGLAWIGLAVSEPILILGFVIQFSIMRILILFKDAVCIIKDVIWTGFGAGIAIFLFPVSFGVSVASFLIVQLIFEMRGPEMREQRANKDRFYDSLKMANEVLRRNG